MPRNYATLSNCYKPLPFHHPSAQKQQSSTSSKTKAKQKQQPTPITRDAGGDKDQAPRSAHECRLMRMEIGVTSATGSALVELGHTKVLCEIIGPTTNVMASSSQTLNMEEGTLECQVQYLPNFGYPVTALVGASASGLQNANSGTDSASSQQQPTTGRLNTQIGGHEKELANQLLSSLSAAVPLKAYPKNVIVVQMTILQDDGSVLSACTIAASLALVNASIEVYDVVTSSTVAVVTTNDGTTTFLADPTYTELDQATATVTLSLLPNWKEVTLWNQAGRLSSSQANEAIGLCRDGCRTMHKFMRNALLLVESTTSVKEENESEDVEMKGSDTA